MSRQEVVAVSLRIVCIYLLWIVFRQIMTLIGIRQIGFEIEWSLANITLILFFIAIALSLWIFALDIADRLLEFSSHCEENVAITQPYSEMVAFRVLGLYVVSLAIPRIFYWSVFIHISKKMQPGVFEPTFENIASLSQGIVALVIGIWLIFNTKGLNRFITLAQHASIKKGK